MNILLDMLRLIPKAGKMVGVLVIILGISAAVFYRWGLVPMLFVLGCIFLIYVVVFLYNKAMKVKERQDGLAFGKALSAAHSGPGKDEVKVAVDDLSRKWQEAMTNLKSRKIDIYQLPWYMLVGEPQSGKSTTLKYSGLQFPIGMEAISGGGGTRNCDWWFTEQGVILDTAGRFTFHEETATDSAEWTHFLKLLAKHRPYCPINGVILVIPVDSLLRDSKAELEAKARNISNKMLNIQQLLAIQFPIYVMITKCDQIYGFTQFFNKMTPDQQREMFGWSNPEEGSGFDPAAFEKSMNAMVGRIDGLRRRHLSQPHFIDDLDKTFVFPEEFRAVGDPLKYYLSIIFQESVYKDPLFFRGFFFCSGLQQGQPIVKACQSMLSDGSMLEKLENIFAKSRAFFVRDFYTRKVFPEEGLVRRAREYARKDILKGRLIYGLNAAMFVLGCLFMWAMYSSLNKRLDRPVQAIDTANARLQASDANFYGDKESRRLIYQSLADLKDGVGVSREKSFLVFLKSKQNALTEHLQDTFAYLFLDRIMLATMDQTCDKLRRLQMDATGPDRVSATELQRLNLALAELKHWQLKVAEGDSTDFKPSLTPFLNLNASDQWDGELADLRGDLTVVENLESWFQEVYTRSSEKVRAFLIEEMVRRSAGMYNNLHTEVVGFYEKQPELLAYREKAARQAAMRTAYEAIQNPAASPEEYHDRLMELASHFSEENLALLNGTSDGYLPFNAIRDKVIEALGPAFMDLKPKAGEGGLLEKTQEALGSGRRDREREKLPAVVAFVNRLLAVNADDLTDPRRDNPPGEEGHLKLDTDLMSFWEKILKPYVQEFKGRDPYASLPEEGVNLDGNLTRLLDAGSDRVKQIRDLFDVEMYNHSASIEDERKRKRFEDAMLDYHDDLAQSERNRIEGLMRDLAADQVEKAPNPPDAWSELVRAFNRYSNGGQKFDEFTKGPKSLAEKLGSDYRRQIRIIYAGVDSPDQEIEDYVKKTHDRLGQFGQTLAELNNISPKELANNRSTYTGSFPAGNRLANLKNAPDSPPIMGPHLLSVGEWADAALSAFRIRVRGADPCPECKIAWSDLKKAVRAAGSGFPMFFRDYVTEQEVKTGEVKISLNLTPEDKLDTLLQRLDVYRAEGTLHRDHIKDLGLVAEMDQALAWADGIKKVRAGGVQILYQVQDREKQGELDSLTTEFTLLTLSGAVGARKQNLNSPRLQAISVNEAAENELTTFRFYNDSPGNQTESLIVVDHGMGGLLAFALANSRTNEDRTYFVKTLVLPLNTGIKKVDGALHLKTSVPLPPPPDWTKLGL